MNVFRRRAEAEQEHEQVEERLDEHARELEQLKRRLRVLERERGIFLPPKLRQANDR